MFQKTVTLSRDDLRSAGACESGMTLFNLLSSGCDIVSLPPVGEVWTEGHWKLADLWLRSNEHSRGHYGWLKSKGWPSANLGGANLRNANLGGANLSGANLTPIRDDVWAVLSAAPAEVPALRAALAEGRIPGLAPNSLRPAEMFFRPIKPGQTAETSQHVKLALEWVDQWLANVRAAIAVLNV